MGHYDSLVSIRLAVFIQIFAWIDPYLDFGCTISHDTPLFNILLWEGVRPFSNGMN